MAVDVTTIAGACATGQEGSRYPGDSAPGFRALCFESVFRIIVIVVVVCPEMVGNPGIIEKAVRSSRRIGMIANNDVPLPVSHSRIKEGNGNQLATHCRTQ